MSKKLPKVEGCGVRILQGDVQAAINEAGHKYRERFGTSPTHVSLPPSADLAGLRLWALNLGHQSGPGVVVVGRATRNGTSLD
jgi:hypothetical protein